MSRGPRHTVAKLMIVVAALAVIMAVGVWMRPRPIIEELRSPIAVVGWSPTGLQLGDGRTLPLPGLRALPATSAALSESSKRGVEVGKGGRVYGLVRVHHWCGNDPVRGHIARVDLALFLEFLGEGQSLAQAIPGVSVSARPGGTFSPFGWRVGEYCEFRAWCGLVKESRAHGP